MRSNSGVHHLLCLALILLLLRFRFSSWLTFMIDDLACFQLERLMHVTAAVSVSISSWLRYFLPSLIMLPCGQLHRNIERWGWGHTF